MEIRASQRRGQARAPRPLHRKLARRYSWQQRLVCGGVLALLCSVAAWLLGLSLPLHLGLVGLGLLLGLFWRFGHTSRRARSWAFGWIEARSGLAYLTAFELPDTDPHGLGDAVRARAAKTAGLDTPPLQPWFLPLVVLALTLALVPHLALPVLRAPFAPPSETASQSSEAVPAEVVPGLEDDATTQDATTTETATTPETGTTADPDATAATNPDAQRSFDTAGGGEEGLSEAQGEQAALDRFLEQTEAAEVSAVQAQNGPSESAAPTQGAQRGGATGAGEAGPGGAAERQNTSAPPSAGNQNAAAPPGQGTPIEREASSGQDPESEGEMGQQRGEPGLSDTEEEAGRSAQGPETPTEEPSTNESQRAESASAESDRQNESLARTGEPTVQRGATSDESSQVTQDIRDGQSSERGGTRGGADIESSRERLGREGGTPERITGIRGVGPTTFGGEALQQGQAPETLPQTGNAGSYRRAAEEVIREGRIPLEYQNIVRDYFR